MVAPTRSTAAHNNHTANASSNASSNASPSNPSKPSAMPSNNANSKDATGAPTTVDNPNRSGEPIIDPELADLPAPPHLRSASTNGAGNGSTAHLREPGGPMSITESIASAPNPRPADFSMLPISKEEIDLEALDVATEEGGIPGSPTAKLMRAIAPPNASQPDPKWPAVSQYFHSSSTANLPLVIVIAAIKWHCRNQQCLAFSKRRADVAFVFS